MKLLLFLFLMLTPKGVDLGDVCFSDVTVYICTGPQSKKYHATKDCRGLNKCSEDIISVSLEKAKSMGRGPCGICYK